MSRNQFNFNQMVKKFALSAFVVVAFAAYAIREHFVNAGAAPAASNSGTSQDANSSAGASASNSSSPTQVPAASNSNSPTQVPVSSAPSNSGAYKNGTYTGTTVDVNYGLVQVQAQIQNGKIAQVTFLQYPNDRRTSQRINSIAMPYLQQEALQAQSANVDIISGATLTSEGFQMSLQDALASAH
jgi:uncharacterized protein with FMN-binding domain